MKKLSLLFTVCFFLFPKAQINDSTQSKKMYIKANALFLPVGILNAGVEYQVSKKTTVQGEVFISPWKSFAGKDAQVYMIGLEGRYYFSSTRDKLTGWHIGPSVNITNTKGKKSDSTYKTNVYSIGAGRQWIFESPFTLAFKLAVESLITPGLALCRRYWLWPHIPASSLAPEYASPFRPRCNLRWCRNRRCNATSPADKMGMK